MALWCKLVNTSALQAEESGFDSRQGHQWLYGQGNTVIINEKMIGSCSFVKVAVMNAICGTRPCVSWVFGNYTQ